jgi:uncharacterized membrane protein YraQ (UPF0718 family)
LALRHVCVGGLLHSTYVVVAFFLSFGFPSPRTFCFSSLTSKGMPSVAASAHWMSGPMSRSTGAMVEALLLC